MKIIISGGGECISYAAEELKKYIIGLSDGAVCPEISCEKRMLPAGEDEIILGGLCELGLDESDLSDPVLDDIIDVKIDNLSGYIAGSNPRSILMGVYRYCESLGVVYVRPGEGGEYIPSADLYVHSFVYRKKADYIFRGECCEGAISYEDMRDTVYYLPKIGMNRQIPG